MSKLFIFLPVINTLLCSFLAIFAISRNIRNPVNIGFFLGMLSLAVVEAANSLILINISDSNIVELGISFLIIGLALLSPSWLIFSLSFGRAGYWNILKQWTPALFAMAVISTVFIFLAATGNIISYYFISADEVEKDLFFAKNPLFRLGAAGQFFFIYLIIGMVLNLVNLENTFRSSSGSKRWQIKYIIFGTGAIFSFFIYLSSKALLFSSVRIQVIPVLSFVILISASILLIFIVRHRLLDIDIFVSRYVVYNSVTVFIVGIYFLLTGLIVEGIKLLGVPFDDIFVPLIVFISILVFVIIFFTTSVRRKVQLFINRNFFKHKYEFRDKWMESIERISSEKEIDATCKTLLNMITATMSCKKIFLWLYDSVSGDYTLTDNSLPDGFKTIGKDHPLLNFIETRRSPFKINSIFDEESENFKSAVEKISMISEASEAVLCAPLMSGNKIIGFILQGRDISGEPYGSDDFEILKAITTQAAVQIENIRLTRDLVSAKEVEAFHKLSSFIIHDLKNLTNSLSLISQNAKYNIDNPEFQQDALKTIDHTVSRMKGLITRFSSLPAELVLNKKMVNINELVKKVIGSAINVKHKNVEIVNELNETIQTKIDSEAIEMVLTNLITNACDAIETKGNIRINGSVSGSEASIIIKDDGIGISPEFMKKNLFQPFKTTKKGGFGIGLYQCKTILEAHGGKLEVESKAGEGSTFTIRIPI